MPYWMQTGTVLPMFAAVILTTCHKIRARPYLERDLTTTYRLYIRVKHITKKYKV